MTTPEIRVAEELVRECDVATLLARWSDLPVHRDCTANATLHRYLERAVSCTQVFAGFPAEGLSGVRVKYRRSETADRADFGGRRFAIDGLSMQGMHPTLRHTLARDVYVDIDMVDAHPTILAQWCAARSPPEPVPTLAAYVADRDARLQEIVDACGVTRDHANKGVLAILNGGMRDADALSAGPAWLDALRSEMRGLHALVRHDPDLERLRAVVAGGTASRGASLGGELTNHVICEAEDRILTAALGALATEKVELENVVLMFDGFMVPRAALGPDREARDLFGAMEAAVRAETGYRVAFAEKAMDEGIDLDAFGPRVPRPPTRIAESHAEAGRMVLAQDLKTCVRFCPGGVVYARTSHGVWTSNRADAHGFILRTIFDSGIKTYGRDRAVPVKYAAVNPHARSIRDRVVSDPPVDPEFPKTLRDANKRKLFFADGVFDFDLGARGEFRAETVDDLPVARIQAPFPRDADRDPALEREVRAKVLEAAFGSDNGKVDTLLRHLARALAGHVEDRDLLIVMGERNSGKGVIATAIHRAFGPYVGAPSNSSRMHAAKVAGTGCGRDEAKKLSWIVALENKRIVISNAVSGGDMIMARRNYTDEAPTYFDARPVLMCNEFPPCKPADALDFVTVLRTEYTYVGAAAYADHADRMPMVRLADDGIKAFVARRDVAAAFTRIVLDAYRREPAGRSDAVQADTVEFRRCNARDTTSKPGGDDGAANGELADMLQAFEFTRDRVDTVSSAEAADAMQAIGAPPISRHKMHSRMEQMGGVRSTNVVRDGKNKRGWLGVRLAPGIALGVANFEVESVAGSSVCE